jgi:hypothetical protein
MRRQTISRNLAAFFAAILAVGALAAMLGAARRR